MGLALGITDTTLADGLLHGARYRFKCVAQEGR